MKKNITNQNDAFTLIELLVVIAIIATIIGLSLPNFLGARARARDARRKGEMNQLKTALQIYYGDYGQYPSAQNGGVGFLNYVSGCGTNGTSMCPSGSCGVDFSAGGVNGCNTTYMTKFPGELGTSMFYYSNNTDFCVTDTLENASDSDIANSHSRCNTKCTALSASLGSTTYAVCSE